MVVDLEDGDLISWGCGRSLRKDVVFFLPDRGDGAMAGEGDNVGEGPLERGSSLI